MSLGMFVTLSIAGGAGAVCRLVLDGVVRSRVGAAFPWGTISINVMGSFVLGLLIGLAGSAVLSSTWEPVAGAGFLGGFTTFSTASVETVRLIQQKRPGPALLNTFGVLIVATAASASGIYLGAQA